MDESTSRISILVVDDDEEVREILVETLEAYGYAVLQSGSGEDALRQIADSADIQMLVSDVRMPGMSGIELVDRAHAIRSELKVILISGYFLPQQMSHRFIKKPFHMRELAAAVAEELGIGTVLP